MSRIRKAFKRLHYPVDIMAQCVRWYLAYSLSLRNLEEIMAERGIVLDHSTLHRLVEGTKVSCHVYTQGDEWYSMLDGDSVIYLADLVDGGLKNKRYYPVKKGDTFCISSNTAHQLYAKTQLDFIFLCPDSL